MKKRIRLTEEDLHRIVKESVNRILRESGEYIEKEMGLPKGGGKYALAKKAARLAQKQGRFNQSDNLEDYANKYFNETFGFNDGTNEFYMNGMGVPEYNGEKIPSHSSKLPNSSDIRANIDRRMNNLKAYPRMKGQRGMETYDNVCDARGTW